jgi:hypothetical protein
MEGSKMKKSLLLWGILSLILVIALLAGCAVNQQTAPEDGVLVQFNLGGDEFASKTILPDEPMDIQKFVVKGWGPGLAITADPSFRAEVNPDVDDQATVVEFLSPGDYFIVVEAYNGPDPDTAFVIGQGFPNDDPVNRYPILPVKFQTIPITVRPVIGLGAADFTVVWPLDALSTEPEITVEIKEIDNTVVESGFFGAESTIEYPPGSGVSKDKKSYTSGDLNNGYYRVVINMYDNVAHDYLLWSTHEAMRIAANTTSTFIVELVEELNAFVEIDITTDMQDPLNIAFQIDGQPYDPESGQYYEFTEGTDITILASVTDSNGDPVLLYHSEYSWWLNGNGQSILLGGYTPESGGLPASESQITLGSGFPAGIWSINLEAVKGNLVASETIKLKILPAL